MTAESERNQKRRGPETHVTDTAFGRTFNNISSVWGFTAKGLVRTGFITLIDTQKISRMSHGAQFVAAMREDTLGTFIGNVTDAIGAHVSRTHGIDEEKIAIFKKRIQDRLQTAIARDKQVAAETPVAIDIARMLVGITGQDVFRLRFALEGAKTLEEFVEIIRSFLPTPHSQ